MIIFQPDIPRLAKRTKWPWQTKHFSSGYDISQYVSNLEIKPNLSCLLLDNYDSYTHNLFQILSVINGKPPFLAKNDCAQDFDSLLARIAFKPDCIVISPGPGSPAHKGDFYVCHDVLKYAVDIPILGVCLGHQGMALAYGIDVVKRKMGPMHGHISKVYHDASELFAGIDQGFDVVRYHSLLVNDGSPVLQKEDCPIQVIARSEDTDIMAIRHASYPHWAVQFHPESVGTIKGWKIVQNFLSAARRFHDTSAATQNRKTYAGVAVSHSSLRGNPTNSSASVSGGTKTLATPVVKREIKEDGCVAPTRDLNNLLVAEAIHFDRDPECAFLELFGNDSTAWWLDSRSTVCQETAKFESVYNHSRFSYMGSPSGCPNSEIVECYDSGGGEMITATKGDQVQYLTPELGILHYLHEKLPCRREFGEVRVEMLSPNALFPGDARNKEGLVGFAGELLPFNLLGGYVGFSGYEVLHDTVAIQSIQQGTRWNWPMGQARSDKDMLKYRYGEDDQAKEKNENGILSSVPKSIWMRASRYIAFDHYTRTAYAVADTSVERKDKSEKWVHNTVKALQKLAASPEHASNGTFGRENEYSGTRIGVSDDNELWESSHEGQRRAYQHLNGEWFVEPAISREQYKDKINECLKYLEEGESYEICLTNQFYCPPFPSSDVRVGALELYKALRRSNPAPYAAFLCHRHYAVCCSSPELFVRLEHDGTIFSKPIKGTAPRSDDAELDSSLSKHLAEDDKTVAENLMILDLIRNDMGRISKVGSVTAPIIMNVESYRNVHHLVSTICGELEDDFSCVDLLAATFPGGSMTGAPKVRTLKILKDLENMPRGVYSGSIGYFSLDGPCVLNIVIRTAVVTENGVSVGAGGAIVSSSNVDEEWNEVLIKANSVLPSVEATYSRLKSISAAKYRKLCYSKEKYNS